MTLGTCDKNDDTRYLPLLAGPASAEAPEGHHPSATTTEGELTASALLRWLMEGTFTSPYLRILLGEENTVVL